MAKRKFTAKEKKEITKMWQSKFPEMGTSRPMELMNILGPIVIGICLELWGDRCHYTPIAHIHNLGENCDFVSLTGSVSDSYKYVSTNSKEGAYLSLVESVRDRFFLPFEGDMHIDDLQESLWKYYLSSDFSDKGYLLIAYFHVTVWTEDKVRIEKSFTKVGKAFQMLYEKGWFTDDKEAQSLEDTFRKYAENPNLLKQTVENNILALGLQDLPRRDILF